MSDETTPGPDLSEQIERILDDAYGHPPSSCLYAITDAAEAALDAKDAEIRRLHTLFDEAKQSLPIEQRRLLAISRMVFDGIAEGRPFTRDEAADLAQRIVDEIGHSVTDEPALGPSFRAEIERLRAEMALRAEADERMTELAADHVSEYAQRAADAEEWAGQLYTAWWSARIGRARARESHRRARAVAQIRGSEVADLKRRRTELIIEVDQLKQALAEVLATFDTAKSSATGEVIGHLAPAAPIHPDDFARWRAALDRSDLPAVREFAAGFDPRKEG